jgi:glycosyltransferase involved in cell wall biosynthesis
MKIAVLSVTQCTTNQQSRVFREAVTLQSAGHHVQIIGVINSSQIAIPLTENYHGIQVHRILASKNKSNLFSFFSKYLFTVQYSLKAYQLLKEFKPHVVHSHDLPTMLLAYFCKLRFGSSIIYDNHELWLDRESTPQFRYIWRIAESILERFLVKKSDAVLMINESLAAIMSKRYHIKVSVLLNYPVPPKPQQITLRSINNISSDKQLILYLGLIGRDHGIEQALEAMLYLDSSYVLIMMGHNLDADYLIHIKELIKKSSLFDRVIFMDGVPFDQVTSYAQSADVGIMFTEAVCTSNQHCFPNKLLESVSAGLPVVVNREAVDVAHFVEQNQVGIAVDISNPHQVAQAICNVTISKYYKASSQALSPQISWDSQAVKLLQIYDEIEEKREWITEKHSSCY